MRNSSTHRPRRTAARRADELALMQYKAGLTNQLTVLNAETNALAPTSRSRI